jgi:hypothetical protein
MAIAERNEALRRWDWTTAEFRWAGGRWWLQGAVSRRLPLYTPVSGEMQGGRKVGHSGTPGRAAQKRGSTAVPSFGAVSIVFQIIE